MTKTFKAVTMNLVLATHEDLYKFRQIGYMYFIWNPDKEEFYEYPQFTHRNQNMKEFFDFFHLERIYIPQNYTQVFYLENHYEKKISS